MSLRDQLIAKGLVSKKQARKANQDLKRRRKAEQGSRKRERELQRKREAEAKAEAEARSQARRERNVAQRQEEEARRGEQIVAGNRVGARGPIPFHFRKRDGKRLGRMSLSQRAAFELRCGRAGIAWLTGEEYVVVTGKGARKLAEVAPERLVFWVEDTKGISDPSEQFLHRQWETALGPHRVTGDPSKTSG